MLLRVKVNRTHLTRKQRGLWYCHRAITQFDAIIDADSLADSPLEEGEH